MTIYWALEAALKLASQNDKALKDFAVWYAEALRETNGVEMMPKKPPIGTKGPPRDPGMVRYGGDLMLILMVAIILMEIAAIIVLLTRS